MLLFLRRKYVLVSVITLFVLIATGAFFYIKVNKGEVFSSELQASSEAKKLYAKVGKHFVLPTDELPTIATVTDPEKLQGQTFFTKAKKGDKVLIFTNAKEAILYDPVVDKVVAVAPLNIDENKIKEGSGTNNTLNNF